MKNLAPIGLLVLLLCNTFGLSFAVFFFDKNYQVAESYAPAGDQQLVKLYLPSLPYAENNAVDIHDVEGLIRRDGNFYNPTSVTHENDTLYVTLQSNEAARDHFFALANAMEAYGSADASIPSNPYAKALKLLNSLLTNYIPGQHEWNWQHAAALVMPAQKYANTSLLSNTIIPESLPTPPPEHHFA